MHISRLPGLGGRVGILFGLPESDRKSNQEKEESADTRAKEISPGKLTSEKDFEKWHSLVHNLLSVLYGVGGVPLSYVIRAVENADPDMDYSNFEEECVARCPLVGPKYEADARKVHQLIASYTTGEHSEQWIKPLKKLQDGCKDMEALRAHYEGAGNQTRRIAEAERLRDTLHYKSEGAMPFQSFLDKIQKMFNIFENADEPYTEAAKL